MTPRPGFPIAGGRDRQQSAAEQCVIASDCDQCGRRAPQLHLTGGRVYCSRCCPSCARPGPLPTPEPLRRSSV